MATKRKNRSRSRESGGGVRAVPTEFLLILNAGSSSLKFCLYGRSGKDWREAARGQIEGIGTAPHLKVKGSEGEALADAALDAGVADGRRALDALASWLQSHYGGARVAAVGHRVVHGGSTFPRPVRVTAKVLAELRRLVPLAPLHQPYNLGAIEAVEERLPGVPQVACFDTSFHHGRHPVAELVPLPAEIRKGGVQRYGFHGLSYEYIASVLPAAAPEIARGKVIVAHLGSGASLCALRNRRSIDTTMGFTALDGLCMGTRPGSVDPGVILHLFQHLGLDTRQVETILYKKSGLLGISGISNDMRELLASRAPAARLAIDYFVYRAAKEIGALTAVLQGLDGLVFTAGIGENSPEIRRRIGDTCVWLSIALDAKLNRRGSGRISKPRRRPSAWVIPTNEELMIARHTAAVLRLTGAIT